MSDTLSPLKWLDMPPVWLAGALVITWQLGQWRPFSLSFGGNWAGLPGGLMVGAGLVLMGLAFVEMRKWKTTVIPHNVPRHMVITGIYKRSRNPIYLGDALVLAGLIFYWDVPIALPLIPVFVWVIERRFIVPEERRLRQTFKADFARYCKATRRWI